MTKKEFPGAWYGEALTSGAYVVLYKDSHLETHQGRLDLPVVGDNVLYVRCTDVGGFRFAGQSHGGFGNWEHVGGMWRIAGPSFSVNPVIYDHAGTLHQAVDSHQGFRFVDDTNRIWTGDETYADPANRIGEWTRHGDVTIGQSAFSCQALYDGRRYVLASGSCRNIVFNRTGNSCAVTIHIEGWGTVMHWFDVRELGQFPREGVIVDPSPPPPPPPPPPPQDNMNYNTGPLNEYAQNRWASLPHETREQQAEALFRILYEFRQMTGDPIEVFRKGCTDTTLRGSDGHCYAEDIVVINEGANGKWYKDCGVQFGIPSAHLNFGAGWARPNGNDADNCVPPPVPANHEPPPDEPPPDNPPPMPDLVLRVAALERETTALAKLHAEQAAEISAIHSAIADLPMLRLRIKALEAEPVTGFDPEQWVVKSPLKWTGTLTGRIEKK
jgi:hypothetical protein